MWTKPIKGTRPLGAAAELGESAKDAAEHVMIVDLERNDLSRVCEPGTVRWPELLQTRRLAGVEHMVSTVEGTLREGVGLAEILEATFPGGSVTGAPKIAAVDLIAELEPVGRGASMGALGRVYGNGDFDLALTIRTFAIAEGRIHLWVGGGVVWDSDPEAEVEESWTKARPLLEAIGSARGPRGDAEVSVARARSLRPRSRRSRRARDPGRRRGAAPRARGVRDAAGLRGPAVSAGGASRTAGGVLQEHRPARRRARGARGARLARPRASGRRRHGAPAWCGPAGRRTVRPRDSRS